MNDSDSVAINDVARVLYTAVSDLPLICPHGHVDPRLFADPDFRFGSPTELLLTPDHYILRLLYSQGISLHDLGISDPTNETPAPDPRRIWQLFADHWYLFRGTPSGIWLSTELRDVFGVTEKLGSESAQAIYDQIAAALTRPEFTPRKLYERFNIALLATTDPATSTLRHHQQIHDSSWHGRIIPTFRPDAVVNLDTPDWRKQIQQLSAVSGTDVIDYPSYIAALEQRRTFFKQTGAVATDHAALTAYTQPLSATEAAAIFQRALSGRATAEDARRFTAHMLLEMARMSSEDGLVMQLHIGAFRNHHQQIFEQFGPDMGGDIPVRSEFTRNLRPLLHQYGRHPRYRLILFTLDESTYTRELAPLAGHYPALRLGPPWWFHDSPNGMRRYFDQVMETAGLYNTVGFNDDTRAFLSIPARHGLWRQTAAEWIAGLRVRAFIDDQDATEMMQALAYGLAHLTYRLA